MKKQLFFYSCFWFLALFTFWDLTGQPFGRPDLNDITFHLQRSLQPLCFLQGSCPYYAPLFSFLVSGLRPFFSLPAAFLIIECGLLFFLLPWAINRLSNTFWKDEETGRYSVLLFLFGTSFSIIILANGIIPQALNIFFLILGLEAMIRDVRSPSHRNARTIALWGILSVLSHQKGWYLYAALVLFWLKERKKYKTALALILAGILYVPNIIVYPLKPWWIPEFLILWINPINLYLALKGQKAVKCPGKKLLDVAILLSFVFAFVDPNYRSILSGAALMAVYSGRGLQKEKNQSGYLFWMIALWVGHLLFVTLGIISLIYIKQF